MSKLLIQESPLQVLPTLAKVIGLNEAIIVQQVHYWLTGKSGKVIEGRRWIYNGYKEWREQFPFWSDDTITRAFRSAEKRGVLLSRQEKSFNRKKWYTLDYDTLEALYPIPQDAESMTANSGNGIPQDAVNKTPQNAVMLTENENTTETTNTSGAPKTARTRPDESALSTLFTELTGLSPKDSTTQRQTKENAVLWYQPIAAMVRQANGTAQQVLREAVERMKKDGLTISSPKSVEKTFVAICGENVLSRKTYTGKA